MKLLVLLVAILFTAIAFISVGNPLRSRYQLTQAALADYSHDIAITRISLAGLTEQAGSDPALLTHLGWGLINSVNQFLVGLVRPGEIDAMRIVTLDGKVLAAATTGSPIGGEWSLGPVTNGVTGPLFYWTTYQKIPALNYLTTIQSKSAVRYYLIATILIDKRWLEVHPRLAGKFRKCDLGIETVQSPQTALLEEGASLVVTNSPIIHQFSLWAAYLFDNNLLVSAFFWAALFLTLAAIYSIKRQNYHNKREIGDFFDWCNSLEQLGQQSVLPQGAQLQRAKEILSGAFACYAAQKNDLKEQKIKLLDNIELQKAQILALRAENRCFSKNKSIFQQIELSTQQFLQTMERLFQIVANLQLISQEAVSVAATSIAPLVKSWQIGLSCNSPRKFLRGLAEESCSNDSNQLDQQLNVMLTAAKDMTELGSRLTTPLVTMRQELQNIEKVVAYWHSLTQRIDDGRKLKLIRVIEESQNLLKTFANAQDIIFNNLTEIPEAEIFCPVDEAALCSILYHLGQALINVAYEHKIAAPILETRFKLKNEQCLVLMNLRDLTPLSYPLKVSGVASAQHHFAIAQKIVASYDVQLIELPVLSGVTPFALNWKLQGESGMTKNHLHQTHHQDLYQN